jgi:sporulation protein YlmC with PRC-barrel domain
MAKRKTGSVMGIMIAAACLLSPQGTFADSSSGSSNAGGNMPSAERIPQDKRTDLTEGGKGVPDEYSTTPVRQGALKEVTDSKWLNQQVTNKQGEKLGTVKKVLKDEKTQDVEYVFLEIADSHQARPMRWSLFQQQGDKLILNAKKDDLLPSIDRSDTKDMSPDLALFKDEIEQKRSEPKPQIGPGDGRGTNRPAPSSGDMGEDRVSGNLGPRGAPPTQAPQFEGEGQKHK